MVFSFCPGPKVARKPQVKVHLPDPPVRVHSSDVDLFRLACVHKQKAKEEADMTVAKARAQLAQTIGHLHLPEDSFSIRNRHLVSRDGVMDIPVRKIIAISPAHGTVMAIWPREEGS